MHFFKNILLVFLVVLLEQCTGTYYPSHPAYAYHASPIGPYYRSALYGAAYHPQTYYRPHAFSSVATWPYRVWSSLHWPSCSQYIPYFISYPSILKVKNPNGTQPSNVNHTEHVFKPVFKWYRPFWSYEGSIQHLNGDNSTAAPAADSKPKRETLKETKKTAKASKKKRKVNKKRMDREPTTPSTPTKDEIEREE